MAFKWKKRYLTPLIILVILIVIRALLPIFVTKFVNKTLSQLEGYEGSISDVDLFILAGSYTICDLRLDKVNGKSKEPFVKIPRSDLSVEWKALFEGAIVGEVELQNPELKFVLGPTPETSQTGVEEDWVKLVQDLMPININRFAANDAIFSFAYTASEPTYKVDFNDFNLEVTNIRNVEDKTVALPSDIVATGYSPSYSGYMRLDAKAFFLKEVPNFNYNMRFEKIKLESLNPLFQYFAGMDFEEGEMDLYSELVLKDEQFDGYFKPIIKDAKIFKFKEEGRPLGQGIKEFFAEGVQELFENQWKNQTATKIPLIGNLETVGTKIWPTIFTALKNAYISALQGEIDDTVSYQEGSEEEAKEKEKQAKKKEKEEKGGFLKRLFNGDDDKKEEEKKDK